MAAVDALLAGSVSAVASDLLCARLRLVQAQLARLRYAQLLAVSELTGRGVPTERGFRGPTQFLQALLHCTARTGRQLVTEADWFTARPALTGARRDRRRRAPPPRWLRAGSTPPRPG